MQENIHTNKYFKFLGARTKLDEQTRYKSLFS